MHLTLILLTYSSARLIAPAVDASSNILSTNKIQNRHSGISYCTLPLPFLFGRVKLYGHRQGGRKKIEMQFQLTERIYCHFVLN